MPGSFPNLISCTAFLLALLFAPYSFSHAKATQSEYESFLSDKSFKEEDDRLNALFKKLAASVSSSQKSALLQEQRLWNKELFYKELNNGKKDSPALERAISAVKQRNSELEKLLEDGAAEPFGLPLKWGMTPAQVCRALEIEGTPACENMAFEYTPDNPENKYPYKKKLLNEETEINFTFLATSFYLEKANPENNEASSEFIKFLARISNIFGVSLNTATRQTAAPGNGETIQSDPLRFLCAVSASFGSEDGYSMLQESLPKKYKSVYISDSAALNYHDDFDLTSDADTYPNTRLFENRTAYIELVPTGGSMEFSFYVSYDDKEYFLLNMPDREVLAKKLRNVRAYNSSFSVCPENADLKTVIMAFGGHAIQYQRYSPDYYILSPQYQGVESYNNIELLMTNDDKLFAFRMPYSDNQDSLIDENAMLSDLGKHCRDMGEENPVVAQFNEFWTNSDRCFETRDNFLTLYFNRYAGSYYFFVANREELAKQVRFLERQNREKEKLREKNKEEIKKTIDDF